MKSTVFLSLLVFIASGILLNGCCPMNETNEAKEAIMQADRDFSQLSIDKGTRVAFNEFMADGAAMLQRKSNPIFGREAIMALFSENDESVLSWEPIMADVGKSGDLGYTIGKYTLLTTDSTGTVSESYGHYVSIWKKQDDGSWKYVFDTGHPGPDEGNN